MLVLIQRNETELKLILKMISINYSILLLLVEVGRLLEEVHNRLRLEIFKKDDMKNTIKQYSKLAFNGIYESYENCDSYKIKQNEVTMNKPIYVGFATLE